MYGWFPQNIATYGADVDRLFYLIYYVVGAWFVVLQGALLWFVIRYRRGAHPTATYARGESRGELAWLLIPAALVLALDFSIDAASDVVWRKVKLDMPPGDLQLAVTAKQFAWTIAYPGRDGRLGTDDDFSLLSELHVPAGRDVRVTLRSTDVLHSFFLPNARLKQDAVPGRAIDVWFNLTTPGRYELACAELCGFGHYTMKGSLVVHPAAEFDQWMAAQAPASAGA